MAHSMLSTAVMTVLSGLHYTYIGLHILQTGYGDQSKRTPNEPQPASLGLTPLRADGN